MKESDIGNDGKTSMSESNTANVRFDNQDGVLVAHVVARHVLQEPTLSEIHDSIVESLPSAQRGLLIDCGAVTGSVSSQFVGSFLQLRKTCLEKDLGFGLCNTGENITTVLEITNLQSVLPTYERVEDAVGQFRARNEPAQATRPAPPPLEVKTAASVPPQPSRSISGTTIATAVVLLTAMASLLWFFYMRPPDEPPLAASSVAEQRRTERPFEVQLHGTVTMANEPAGQARIYVWPGQYQRVELEAAEGHADAEVTFPTWPVETSVDNEGKYELTVSGHGRQTDLCVLVVADNQQPEPTVIPPDDYRYLAAAFEDPAQLIGTQRFVLQLIEVQHGDERLLDVHLE